MQKMKRSQKIPFSIVIELPCRGDRALYNNKLKTLFYKSVINIKDIINININKYNPLINNISSHNI
jgi:hypothetical protein